MNLELSKKIRNLAAGNLDGSVKTFENLDSTIELNSKATEEQITTTNKYFKLKIPDDYLVFLKEFDGATFFKVQDFAGFYFLSSKDLIKENDFQKLNFGDDWNDDIIIFCCCIGDGEFLGMRINSKYSYEIVDCLMDQHPSTWEVIHESIDSLLNKLIESKGKKFWLTD